MVLVEATQRPRFKIAHEFVDWDGKIKIKIPMSGSNSSHLSSIFVKPLVMLVRAKVVHEQQSESRL
ncbi:hypothetical protein Mapa_008030 [Marchantia paleacea]|nr:hypothetical protein Mapa_008030 [Marchantia paleacea]